MMNVLPESFPNAPQDWNIKLAEETAKTDGLELNEDHLELIRALQEYYFKVEFPHMRQIKDALNVPAGAVDRSFGSVA